MGKIILAINTSRPDKNSLEFACYLGRLTNSAVTGIFLNKLVHERASGKILQEVVALSGNSPTALPEPQTNAKPREEEIIRSFEEIISAKGVKCHLEMGRGVHLNDLIEESRFADVLIVDPAISFNTYYGGVLADFIKKVFQKTECPVIISPENFLAIDEIVFTYDGFASSVFAMKQFTYIFPQLYKKKVSVIQVNGAGKWNEANKNKLNELLMNHYTDLHFETLTGRIDNMLFEYTMRKKNIFLVMGAYGRNGISTFFRPSHADVMIRTIPQPIFIAHK